MPTTQPQGRNAFTTESLAYIFLGVAQEHLENHQQAFECYKKGLFNVIGKDIHQSTKLVTNNSNNAMLTKSI
ncbi:MAG: hypothetical protein AAGB12_05360 [Pseudomonadota bacterium]